MLDVSIFLDPSRAGLPDTPPDYDFSLMTSSLENATGDGIQTPKPGEPVIVPIDQLWDAKNLYNNSGEIVGTLEAIADPNLDTLTLTGKIPGITSEAVYTFSTFSYDGTLDRPDNIVPLEQANVSTPAPGATGTPSGRPSSVIYDPDRQLIPAEAVRAYPGPEHYAGDVLTFEIQLNGDFSETSDTVTMTLDDGPATLITAELMYGFKVVLPLALDTAGLSGNHKLRFSTPGGSINETYSLNVLPADQRPANEENASWMSLEIDCCVLHYLQGTAAARDIRYIADHFQKAATDFHAITGKRIDPKLQIYFIDRMWGNGGFGGTGELVISYSDRYYGPTVGAAGLETLARHEFTHAAGIGLDKPGDGVEINAEGLAVYVAGGHYKPEPLAERGGALYDLGYYVPVGQTVKQHEVSYLYSAAMLTYIADSYGTVKLWDFLATDEDPLDGIPTPLPTAIQLAFGISLQQFDHDFRAWLEKQDPGEQLDDLRLTIELQDLRRQYQDTYAPPPFFIYRKASEAVALPEYEPVLIREANAVPNVTVELIIANAQKAIVAGDYSTAEILINTLSDVVSTGRFEDPIALDYLQIVLVMKAGGYEVETLDIQGDRATAQVEKGSILPIERLLQKSKGVWQTVP